MNELDTLRGQIDAIDAELIDLFIRRMQIAEKIGVYKKQSGKQILDNSREQRVLESAALRAQATGLSVEAQELMKKIMELSRAYQARQRP